MTRAWLVRLGKFGEQEAHALEKGELVTGWKLNDISGAKAREDILAELPHATDFQLHIFAALAQEERRLISDRTRLALAEAKRRGVILGRNGILLGAANRERANKAALMLLPTLEPLIREGQSYSAIARHLNAKGVRSSNGGHFHPETVKNAVRRLGLEISR